MLTWDDGRIGAGTIRGGSRGGSRGGGGRGVVVVGRGGGRGMVVMSVIGGGRSGGRGGRLEGGGVLVILVVLRVTSVAGSGPTRVAQPSRHSAPERSSSVQVRSIRRFARLGSTS